MFVAFAEDGNVTSLEVRCLERGEGLAEGAKISVAEPTDVVRRMLREEVICKLEAPGDDFAYAYDSPLTPTTRLADTRTSAVAVGTSHTTGWRSSTSSSDRGLAPKGGRRRS